MNNILKFENTELRVFDRNGQPWFSAADLARALHYDRTNEVSQLYRRHQREFDADMTSTIRANVDRFNLKRSKRNLQTTIRIFSPRGALLVAMLARTEVGRRFRVWVLDLIEGKQELSGGRVNIDKDLYIELLERAFGVKGGAVTGAVRKKQRKAQVKPAEDPITEAFFAAIRPHLAKLDHSCKPEFLALHMTEVYQRAEFWGLELPYIRDLYAHLKRRSDYVANKAIHSRRDGGKRQCWIFRRPPQLRLVQCGGGE